LNLRRNFGACAALSKELSVIVPTYNETENIRPLCERLFKATGDAGLTAELFIVDDESSGSARTEAIVNVLKDEGHPVQIYARKKTEGKGLTSAVLLGFDRAKYNNILCMDADLQHRPEEVPGVARPVLHGEAEFSTGSRYCKGARFGFRWSLFRTFVSYVFTMLAKPVAESSDPMSGFFCTRKDVLKRGRARVNTKGFKVGMEVNARTRANPVIDVPITFDERVAGESKADSKIAFLLVAQLLELYWDRFGLLLVAVVLAALAVLVYVTSFAMKMFL
jgi:dolichol-phosphate mannosyltransferase